MVLIISQIILTVSLGGMVLMLVRKMPVLVKLPNTPSQTGRSWRVNKKLFPIFKTSTFSIKQRMSRLKQTKKIDLENDGGQIQQVEQGSDYWTNIRQG